jgi:peptidoglycan/xylan/chitin deacetylase (PgdA/CDA1 family)
VNQKSKGNISGIYKNAIDQGHTVGLQVNPNRDYDDMDADEIDDDVARQLDAIKNLTDTDVKYAKGPVTDGEPNADLYNVLAQNDITMPYYNFCPYDHDDPMGEFESTIRTSNPKYDSFMVLLHDKQEADTPYLREIVELGRENGYEFVNMDQCLGDYKPEDGGDGFKPKDKTAGVQSIGSTFLPLLVVLVHFL